MAKNPHLLLDPNCKLTPGLVQGPRGGRVALIGAIDSVRGTVPNAWLTIRSNDTTSHYHKEFRKAHEPQAAKKMRKNENNINSTWFTHWFIAQLLPNVPEGSIIVMDNSSVHLGTLEGTANSKSRKEEMRKYLASYDIDLGDVTRSELWEKVKQLKAEDPDKYGQF